MKFYIGIMLIFFISISIAGCVNEKPEEMILGRWEGEADNFYLEFYKDGTLILKEDDYKEITKYIFMDDNNFGVHIEVPELSESITGETIIEKHDEIIVFRINRITKNELTIENLDDNSVFTLKKV